MITATKKMTAGRSAVGGFGFEVDGEVVKAVFKVEGKGHDVCLILNKSELLSHIATLTVAPSPSPVVEAPAATALSVALAEVTAV